MRMRTSTRTRIVLDNGALYITSFKNQIESNVFYNLPIEEDVDGIHVDDLVGDTIMK